MSDTIKSGSELCPHGMSLEGGCVYCMRWVCGWADQVGQVKSNDIVSWLRQQQNIAGYDSSVLLTLQQLHDTLAEIDRLANRVKELESADYFKLYLSTSQARDRLRNTLKRYGHHKFECVNHNKIRIATIGNYQCICGWDQILAGID